MPPKANSLDKVLDRRRSNRGWWATHRPPIVETAALGDHWITDSASSAQKSRQQVSRDFDTSASSRMRYSTAIMLCWTSYGVAIFQMPGKVEGLPRRVQVRLPNPSRDQVRRQILHQSPLAKFNCPRYLARWVMPRRGRCGSIGGNGSLSGASRRFLFPLVVGTTMRHLLAGRLIPNHHLHFGLLSLGSFSTTRGRSSSPWLSKRFFQGDPVQLRCSKRRNRIRSRSPGE